MGAKKFPKVKRERPNGQRGKRRYAEFMGGRGGVLINVEKRKEDIWLGMQLFTGEML